MNDEALFSEHWHRVRTLKPSLGPDVAISRHSYRGVPWYVLYRASSGAYFRVRAHEFEFINQLDGVRTVDELWRSAVAARDAAAPTQPQLLALIAELHEADLLRVDRRLSVDRLFARRTRSRQADTRRRFLNPLFLRFTLCDPDALLNRLAGLARVLFSRGGALAWVVLGSLALMQLLPRWAELRLELAGFEFLSPETGLTVILAFPLIKLLHEIAHGLAVKRFGGEVHELGIALLVLLPVPFLNASAAAAFPRKSQRMLVGAAGILIELGIAAAAALVWSLSEPGWLHDTSLVIMLIGGLSTLLFNGNPLLKFDGYYVLADALEIPNLADRSRQYLLQGLGRGLFGANEEPIRAQDRREAVWLVGYAIGAASYRLVLTLLIAYMVAGRFFFFGVALAIWVIAVQLFAPLWRLLVYLRRQPRPRHLRVASVASLCVVAVAALLGAVPLPLNTVASAVVWLPEHAIVRVGVACEVIAVSVESGARVEPGDPLFECDGADLVAELALTQARIGEHSAERAGVEEVDRARRQMLDQQIASLQAEHRRLLEQRDELRVQAGSAGRFTVADEVALAGQHLEQGAIAAFVVPDHERTIRLALRQAQAGRLTQGVRGVKIRFAEGAGVTRVLDTHIVRQTPRAGLALPSAALTTLGGGDLPADPADSSGRTSLEPVFDLHLAWPERAPDVQVGGHVFVEILHPPAPLAERLITGIRRAFIGRLDL